MLAARISLAIAISSAMLLATGAAAAPVERFIEIGIHPGDPEVMVLRYENGGGGLLYSNDAGRTFRLLCTSAIDPSMRNAGTILLTGDGRVLMGLFEGMWQDDGRGCGWSVVPALDGRWVTDVAAHPTDLMTTFTITSSSTSDTMSGILQRDANGQWSDVGKRENLLITRLAVASTPKGLRFYQSIIRGQTMPADGGRPQPIYMIRVSDDAGESWQEHSFDAPPDGTVRLEAVDPTNAERIVVVIDRSSDSDSVMVSADRGQTFSEYLVVSDFSSIAFAPDGRVWIGEPSSISTPDASRGLWFAESLESPAAKIADYGVECLSYQPATETLYVCQAFGFGTADATSGAFTELFKFSQLKDFVSCEGVDMPATCQVQLCKDYCGAGHFAQAPLCCAYNDPLCGPSVAESEGTGTRAQCGGVGTDAGVVDGGLALSGAGGGSGNAGSSSSAGAVGAPGVPEPDSGAKAPLPSSGGDGDACGCRTPGRGRTFRWHVALAGLALTIGVSRRRAPKLLRT